MEDDAEWAVLFYLAGDLDSPRGGAIRTDLCEILSAGRTKEVFVAAQYDCKENCYRYVAEPAGSGTVKKIFSKSEAGEDGEGCYAFDGSDERIAPTEVLGRINSGDESELESFLVWGLSRCPAERVAVVLSGKNRLDNDRLSHKKGRHPTIFTICRDDSTRAHLGFVDFSIAIQKALAKAGRERIDILALDSTSSQFLELAHELGKNVDVLVGPQTAIPMSGWNYARVLEAWHFRAKEDQQKPFDPDSPGADSGRRRRPTSPVVRGVGKLLVDTIGACYGDALKNPVPSNEDLSQYAEDEPKASSVSAIDLTLLDQVSTNFDTICLSFMQVLGEGAIWSTRQLLHEFLIETCDEYYDLGRFVGLFDLSMRIKAASSTFDWVAWTLRNHGSGDWNRNRMFWNKLRAQFKRDQPPEHPWLVKLQESLDEPEGLKRKIDAKIKEDRKHREIGIKFITFMWDSTNEILDRWRHLEPSALDSELKQLQKADDWLWHAIQEGRNLLSGERQQSLDHASRVATIATRLASQSKKLSADLRGEKGVVIHTHSTDKEDANRWTGVSIHRPQYLEELMGDEYQRFSFHRKIHWAALLGAVSLIGGGGTPLRERVAGPRGNGPRQTGVVPSIAVAGAQPPLAMWRLISSLLTTGSAESRRDLLNRLSGSGSVIWGMHNQFRVLAPAPMITLSVERREGAKPFSDYVVRMESTRGDAVIFEHTSRVHEGMLDRVLKSLSAILDATDIKREEKYAQLVSLGGILGDEVLQDVGRTLDQERRAIHNHFSGLGIEHTKVHLQIQLPRNLMQHPWELMTVYRDVLGENFAVGRRVYMEPGATRPVTERQQGSIRALVVVPHYGTDPGHEDLEQAEREGKAVCKHFKQLRKRLGDVVNFDEKRDYLHGKQATWLNFRRKLGEGVYDIIHFAGHGTFDPKNPELSSWNFPDGPVTASMIRNTLLNLQAPPWLVYANACNAAMEDGASKLPSYRGSIFGLASAFINHGVAAYIAPIWEIEDYVARDIALAFYDELLLERRTLGEALLEAKCKQRDKEATLVDGDIGWASVVLYGDPTGELLQALAGKEVDPMTAANRQG